MFESAQGLLTGNPCSLARAINTDSAHSTSFLHRYRNKNQRGYGCRERRLISLLEFSDQPEASKFADKCGRHSQNGKSMEITTASSGVPTGRG